MGLADGLLAWFNNCSQVREELGVIKIMVDHTSLLVGEAEEMLFLVVRGWGGRDGDKGFSVRTSKNKLLGVHLN